MKYYDIELNFNDYPIQYYEWESSDNVERLLSINIIKVYDISDLLVYNCSVDLEDGKYIFSDSVNSIGVEVINKDIVYLSYLKYEDDNYISDLVKNLDYSDISITRGSKREIINVLRSDLLIRKVLINLINTASDSFIKYLYYDRVNRVCNDIDKCKRYLINDLDKNLSNYYSLYEMIVDK